MSIGCVFASLVSASSSDFKRVQGENFLWTFSADLPRIRLLVFKTGILGYWDTGMSGGREVGGEGLEIGEEREITECTLLQSEG